LRSSSANPVQTPDLRAELPSLGRDVTLQAGYLARLVPQRLNLA
jgi:hypothetical protein